MPVSIADEPRWILYTHDSSDVFPVPVRSVFLSAAGYAHWDLHVHPSFTYTVPVRFTARTWDPECAQLTVQNVQQPHVNNPQGNDIILTRGK